MRRHTAFGVALLSDWYSISMDSCDRMAFRTARRISGFTRRVGMGIRSATGASPSQVSSCSILCDEDARLQHHLRIDLVRHQNFGPGPLEVTQQIRFVSPEADAPPDIYLTPIVLSIRLLSVRSPLPLKIPSIEIERER